MATPSEAIEASRKAAGLQFPLKDKQIETLTSVLAGQDVLSVLPTGYGKSMTFTLLPSAWDTLNGHNPGTSIVIVISPLVALMEEQLNKLNTLGIPSVHLGSPENSPETISRVKNGQFPLVFLSPEGLFTGQWREVLASPLYRSRVKTICVDEAHVSVIWGAQFRTDYARIGELRSILPGANMLALTASAPPSMRLTIAELLGMRASHLKVIEVSVDRPNIMYTAVRSPQSVQHTLYWIADELREHQQHCPKYIIYCRSVKDVAKIYQYFHDELGSDGYIGTESVRSRLFAMFHRSTRHRVKKFVLDTFPIPESSVRVVICTIAFGMGIDVPDVKAVVHWGAARTFEGFFQECGRAGRDSQILKQAYSIVYHQATTVCSRACDDTMRTFCINEENKCRREMILKHFSTIHQSSFRAQQHNCCDVCHSKCKCGQCPPLPGKPPLEVTDSELIRSAREAEEEDAREVSPALMSQLKTDLLNLRETYDIEFSLVSGGLLSGLQDQQIDAIINGVTHIHCTDDLMTEYLYDTGIASKVMDLINDIFD